MRTENRHEDYWAEVRNLADECISEARENRWSTDDIETWLHETIDSHEFVIYTGPALDVLRHCSNENAYTDEFGDVPRQEGGGINWHALAYFALLEDVRARIDLQGFDISDPVYTFDEVKP